MVGRLWPAAQIRLATCFCKYGATGTQPCPLIYVLSVGYSHVTVAELSSSRTIWLHKAWLLAEEKGRACLTLDAPAIHVLRSAKPPVPHRPLVPEGQMPEVMTIVPFLCEGIRHCVVNVEPEKIMQTSAALKIS